MLKNIKIKNLIFTGLFLTSTFFLLLNPYSHPIAQKQVFNDVSRLNPTPVREIFQPTNEEEIKDKILQAKHLGLHVAIAGKRHSQGGQQSCEDCIVLDMLKFNKVLALDTENKVIRVQSGATWDQIQRYINPFNLSLKVMQTSNIFTVGGSLSANVHGRDARYGDMRKVVKSFRLLLADGSIVNVSREGHSELFQLVIGGLGLFGIILDVEIELTNNNVYKKEAGIMNYKEYPGFLKNILQNQNIWLHFAILSIASDKNFLREMIVTSYKTSDQGSLDRDLKEETHIFRNKFFLALSRRFDWGKTLRWNLQKSIDGNSVAEYITRNNAMRPPIKFLEYNSPWDTDILQEYFVPIDQFVDFVDGLRKIVKNNKINLLHVGIRYVPADSESFLPYAQGNSIALVLYINQKLSDIGKKEAKAWTQQLVDLVLELKGAYYLVYQLYPTAEQLRKAYPNINQFFDQKRVYDPELRFINQFFETYGFSDSNN